MSRRLRLLLAAGLSVLAGSFTLPVAAQQSPAPPAGFGAVSGADANARIQAARTLYASLKPPRALNAENAMPLYAARLDSGIDVPATLQSVDAMLGSAMTGRRDPFDLHAIMNGYLLTPTLYTPAMTAKVRAYAASWDYTRDIGVSLNYRLMRDGAGYLAAQTWPDFRDRAGNDAQRVKALCRARLMQSLRETTLGNASEYLAPLYLGTDMMAVRMIAEFSLDSELARAAQMTLEFLLIQTGAFWDNGYLIAPTTRAKYWGSDDTGPDSEGATTGMAYLFFGGARPARLDHLPQVFWLAYPGRALPGEWLSRWQAALPGQRSVTAALTRPRGADEAFIQAWLTPAYGVASERTDRVPATRYHYKEERRTMLKWVSPYGGSTFTVVQDNRRRPSETIKNAFGYGENPYAQVLQSGPSLVCVYDVPPEYGFWDCHAPFSTSGAIVRRIERGGWVVCHAGVMLWAFRFLQPAQWGVKDARDRLDLYDCNAPKGGWILETSPLAPYAGGGPDAEIERFAGALARTTEQTSFDTGAAPRVVFRNLAGHVLDLTWHPPGAPYSGQCVVDGKTVDAVPKALLQTGSAYQGLDGRLSLTLPGGGERTYDFQRWAMEPAAARR